MEETEETKNRNGNREEVKRLQRPEIRRRGRQRTLRDLPRNLARDPS
jgi:hypothetical protein